MEFQEKRLARPPDLEDGFFSLLYMLSRKNAISLGN